MLDALLVDVNVVMADDPPPAMAILSFSLFLFLVMSDWARECAISIGDGDDVSGDVSGDCGEDGEVAETMVFDWRLLFVIERLAVFVAELLRMVVGLFVGMLKT